MKLKTTRDSAAIQAEMLKLDEIRRLGPRKEAREAAIAHDTLRWVVKEMAILPPSRYLAASTERER